MALTLPSFPQFTTFPPEIHSLIVEACLPLDRICLRLTCKYLYNHSPPPKEPISLDTTDTGPLCGLGVSSSKNWRYGFGHRKECHKKSYEAYCERQKKLGRSVGEMKRKCRTSWQSYHCECYTRRTELHFRLQSWMPKGLNYCGECEKFTKRKRQHNGRCFHGKPKERKSESNYWTHTSRGGAFGRKIWKKWFNNRAMNRLERRLAEPQLQRKGSQRYAMRTLESREVNTREIRDARGGL